MLLSLRFPLFSDCATVAVVWEVDCGCDRFRAIDCSVFSEEAGFKGAEWVVVMLLLVFSQIRQQSF